MTTNQPTGDLKAVATITREEKKKLSDALQQTSTAVYEAGHALTEFQQLLFRASDELEKASEALWEDEFEKEEQ
jgi:hypothetical protein